MIEERAKSRAHHLTQLDFSADVKSSDLFHGEALIDQSHPEKGEPELSLQPFLYS